jgi:hypothetical protein
MSTTTFFEVPNDVHDYTQMAQSFSRDFKT